VRRGPAAGTTTRIAKQPDAPHHRYFMAKEGHWRGKIRFEITDRRGLRASSVRWADKWSFRSLSMASRLPGLVLNTTVDSASGADRGEVPHTTRVTNLGMPVRRSADTIFLVDGGRGFRVEGREAFFPFLRRTDWSGSGEVATHRDGTSYRIKVFGLTMEQETRTTGDGLQTTRRTASPARTIC
jgi:hypothetical protein